MNNRALTPAVHSSELSNESRRAMGLILLVIAAAAIAFAFWALPLRQYVINALEWTQNLGLWAPVVVVLFYVAACLLFLPGSLITLGAGVLFGPLLGTVVVMIGANLGANAAFLVGRTLGREWVASRVAASPRFSAIYEAVAREGFKITLLLRLSPIFPFNFLNYSLGLTEVSFSNYALASLIGMFPGTLMYVYLGSAARNLAAIAAGQVEAGAAGQIFFWVGLAATVVVAMLVTRVARKSLALVDSSVETEREARADKPPIPMPDKVAVSPDDEHNRELLANTHPPDWVNPEPAERYNLVVIGAGTAGLVTAAGAAGLGAKVALVERHLMGGDCLNVGCVPSKCMIRSSRVVGDINGAADFGVRVNGYEADFPRVMERLRRLRAQISRNDSAVRFRDLGVDVFLGHARFTGPDTVDVAGKTLRFSKAVIATGARAVQPNIPGLAEAGFLTNETVFSLTESPSTLAVIGGGPIGCELAQAFGRLGSKVVLFHNGDHILNREDADAADIVQERFIEEGIRLVLESKISRVELRDSKKVIHFEAKGQPDSIEVDEILVGAGRAPNVENMGLEMARVQYDTRQGILVDDRLQTTNPKIFAAGDVCMKWKFTHAADAAARIVIQNALFKGSKRLSALTTPWCTYTDPEIAHVGMYEHDAEKQGIEVDTYFRSFEHVDRAIADGQTEGFVKIHVVKGKDKIVGATIVGAHAGESISEITLAMVGDIGLGTLANVIHPYPTQAEAIKQAADAYNRTRLTPFLKKLFAKWLEWNR